MTSEDVHKQRSRAAYDRYARDYDSGPPGRHARWLHDAVLEAFDSCPGDSVLDVGCGTGALLERIVERRPGVAACGIDLSPEMISVARRRLGDTVDLRVADAEALPLDDAAFDVVLCVDSFHHYPRPGVALSEMRRVTRGGGTLVLAEWRMVSPIRQIMNALMDHVPDGDVRVYTRRELEQSAADAGYQVRSWSKAGRRGQLLVCST